MTQVKICGLSDTRTVEIALKAGADWIGVVCAPASPRHVPDEALGSLASAAGSERAVLLLVDPDDSAVERGARSGFGTLQLHGQESPERVAEIRKITGLEVWKAVGVSTAVHLAEAHVYSAVDRLLLDARPPRGATRTGGHGRAFDWAILDAWDAPAPWMLAGGLTPDTVADAVRRTRAPAVDVSSGVEAAPGQKDLDLIERFIAAAKNSTG